MRHVMKFSLAVMFFMAMVSSTFAADLDQLSAPALYQRVLDRIGKIEQSAAGPQCQLQIFELRDEVRDFYSHNSQDYTDPVDRSTGLPIVADLSKGADMYDCCKGLKDGALKRALHDLVDHHRAYDYRTARGYMFGDIDNHGGEVECVYTGRTITTKGIPGSNNMNCEHTWPQSKGATGDAKTDLHHLFPADSKANSIRGNHPFGNVSDPTWEQGGSKFNKSDEVFEIRPEQRGNSARAMFYFSIRYNKAIDDKQEKVLRQWSKEDPVDAQEKKRCDRIQNLQNNRNPFVDHPEFIDMIDNF